MTSVAGAAVTRQYASPKSTPALHRLPLSGLFNFDDGNNENVQIDSNSRRVLRDWSWLRAMGNNFHFNIDDMEVDAVEVDPNDLMGPIDIDGLHGYGSTTPLDLFGGSSRHGHGAESNENQFDSDQQDHDQQENIDIEIENDFLKGKTRVATVIVVLLCCWQLFTTTTATDLLFFVSDDDGIATGTIERHESLNCMADGMEGTR